MNHPLDGVRQKLIRAEEHLTPIKTGLEACLEKCSMISQRHIDAGNHQFRFTVGFPKPDLALSVIIGECLHNLRSALDHIVWQLVLANNQTPVKENMFPVCDTPAGFARHVQKNRLRGVSVQAQAVIEGLQPYQGGQLNAHLHPLWVLNQLTNIDKHRTLALTTIRGDNQNIVVIDGDGQIIGSAVPPKVLRDSTEIIIDASSVSDVEKVIVEFKTKLTVAFNDAPVTDREVNSIMHGLCKFMKNSVVPAFEPFF